MALGQLGALNEPQSGRSPQLPRARRRGLLLTAGVVLVAALATFVVLFLGSFAQLGPAFAHPIGLGCVSLLLVAAATSYLVPWRWLGTGVVVICGLVAIMWVVVGMFFLGPRFAYEAGHVSAPGAAGYEALRVERFATFDREWNISIQQTRGLLSRRWQLGCITDDAPAHRLKSLRWEGPETLVIITPSEKARISVDTETGAPTSTAGIWNC